MTSQTAEPVEKSSSCALTMKQVKGVIENVCSRRADRTQIIGALSPSEWAKLHGLLIECFGARDIRHAGRTFRAGLSELKLREKEQIQACNIVASSLFDVVSTGDVQSWRMATNTIAG